jgi:DNA-binding transcriptional regulator YhcF (GntR family)
MARHTGGWVKIYRAAILGDIGESFIRIGLFNALVAFANLQSSTVVWKGKPRKLARGELVTSLQELADLGGADKKTISRHLNYLALRETIFVEKSATGTFVKINNYEEYQGQDAEGSTQGPRGMDHGMDNDVHAIGIHNEERKNKRNKEIKNNQFLSFEFERLAKKYRTSFKGTTTGPNALKSFNVQIKTPEDVQILEVAINHYRALLDHEDWRKPKSTFATFLGSKSKGFFWRDFIEMPEVGGATNSVPSMDEILASRKAGGSL